MQLSTDSYTGHQHKVGHSSKKIDSQHLIKQTFKKGFLTYAWIMGYDFDCVLLELYDIAHTGFKVGE